MFAVGRFRNSSTVARETFLHVSDQWHTQKIFMGEFHSVACGSHLYLVCAVCDVTI